MHTPHLNRRHLPPSKKKLRKFQKDLNRDLETVRLLELPLIKGLSETNLKLSEALRLELQAYGLMMDDKYDEASGLLEQRADAMKDYTLQITELHKNNYEKSELLDREIEDRGYSA